MQFATLIYALKWILGILIVGTIAFTVWLVVLNRDSEKVMLTALPAAALGTFGVLITILFGLKGEIREREFPALFTYERASLIPYGLARNIGYLPPSEKVAAYHINEIKKTYPDVLSKETKSPGMDLYGDIVLRLVFDSLAQTFNHTWDVKIRRSDLPFFVPIPGGYDPESPTPVLIQWHDLSALFPQSYTLRTPPTVLGKQLALPPGTRLFNEDKRHSDGGFLKTAIVMQNDFVDLEIAIILRGGSAHIGVYGLVTTLPEGDEANVWMAHYLITMKAKFKTFRSGHPDMPKYQVWVSNVFETVSEQLDSQRHWELKRREIRQTLESNLGPRIGIMENSIKALEARTDEILHNLLKPKKQG